MSQPRVIILAAGEGTRLRPFTQDRPKCLVPYKGTPLLQQTLSVLKECNLTDIVIVAGYRAEMLSSYAEKVIVNQHFKQTNMVESLFCAEAELAGDTIISYGDITYRRDVLESLLNSTAAISVVVDERWEELWNQRMENPLDDAESLKISGDGCILEIGLTPRSREDIDAQYIGLIKISKDAINRVKTFYRSLDRTENYRTKPFSQMYMTTFLQLIIDRLMPVHAVMTQGGWIEIDTPSDLDCEMI